MNNPVVMSRICSCALIDRAFGCANQGTEMKKQSSMRSSWGWWIAAGITLIALNAWIVFISPRLGFGSDNATAPILLFVCLFISAAAVHLTTLTRIPHTRANAWLVAWVVAVGIILRASAMLSEPILESDFYRYLWEGGVVAHGFNPYTCVPEQAAQGGPEVPAQLHQLAVDSGEIVRRINHAPLATCYPPVAELMFAVAHLIRPWSLTAWRVVLLAFDAATLALLFAVLRQLGRSPLYAAVYWWCPLVVKEGFNSAHMDILIPPFVLGALWLGFRSERVRDRVGASGLLAFAVGIKFWPIVLAPVLFRPMIRKTSVLIPSLAVFCGILGLQFLALLPSLGMGEQSGLLSYGREWELNDALFMALLWMVRRVPWVAGNAELITRGIVACILGMVILLAVRKEKRTPEEWCRRALWIVAALFLLSPTQFPWYYLWVLPLLVLTPRPALLLLTALLPLYYLLPRFDSLGRVDLFEQGIVWLEFVPVWCLLVLEGLLPLLRPRGGIGKGPPCETAST